MPQRGVCIHLFPLIAPTLIVVSCRPRLIRMVNSQNWSLHDLVLVDCKYAAIQRCHWERVEPQYAAPEFHLVIQSGQNGEVYNMAIRGMDSLTSNG